LGERFWFLQKLSLISLLFGLCKYHAPLKVLPNGRLAAQAAPQNSSRLWKISQILKIELSDVI
jgi:hypothetical protein